MILLPLKKITLLVATASLFILPAALAQNTGLAPYHGARHETSPKIINVSGYDPKERQREGSSFSVNDLSALKNNGAHGFIARIAKGNKLDKKAAPFLKAADNAKMLLGVYYYLKPNLSITTQADLMLNRLQNIGFEKKLTTKKVLLVGDIDRLVPADDIAKFITHVYTRTGIKPVIYLENSDTLKTTLRKASPRTKSIIRSSPYWMALYGHIDKMDSIYSVKDRVLTPQVLLDIYQTWDKWTMWQYGGVWWDTKERKSAPHYYNYGKFNATPYFKNIDRPCERNVFNGSVAELNKFWEQHSWDWRLPLRALASSRTGTP